jgi:hypothetical protein
VQANNPPSCRLGRRLRLRNVFVISQIRSSGRSLDSIIYRVTSTSECEKIEEAWKRFLNRDKQN